MIDLIIDKRTMPWTEEHKQRMSIAQKSFYKLHPEFRKEEKNGNWKGGRSSAMGYILIYVGKRKYKLEHSLIAEQVLGRKLKKGEIVHHINDNRADNRNCNLLICTIGYHRWLHEQMSKAYMQEHFGSK